MVSTEMFIAVAISLQRRMQCDSRLSMLKAMKTSSIRVSSSLVRASQLPTVSGSTSAAYVHANPLSSTSTGPIKIESNYDAAHES